MPSAAFIAPHLSSKTSPAGAAPLRTKRRRSDRLPNAAILVVEDEYLVAEDLARQIVFDGSTVVGPAPTPAAALDLLAKTVNIGGAVLDVRLGTETAFAIAEKLHERAIPFVFFTAYDDIPWPPQFRSTPKISKTADWRDLKRILFGPRERRKRRTRDLREDVAAMLPILRESARKITGDRTTGDRLVEQVLETAIAQIEERGKYSSVKDWLMSVLRKTSEKPDERFLN